MISDNYHVDSLGRNLLGVARSALENLDLTKTLAIGGDKDIVTAGDIAAENAVESYLREQNIPVNLDGEEKRQRKLCANPLGKITLDPIDGTDNYATNTLHYCTIVTIFDDPDPRTLGEAIWAGIFDHQTQKEATFHKGRVFFRQNGKDIEPRPLKIRSINDLVDGVYLRVFHDLGPRETSDQLKPYDDILKLSWRKNVSCAGYHFMEIAYGGRDVAILPCQKPEELVAGIPLIERMGGAVLTFDGKRAGSLPYDFDKRYQVVAARTPVLAREIISMIK